MASASHLLKNSLYDLKKDELKEFQWHLRNDYKFPASELEKADVLDTADKMVEREKQEGAVKITLDILRKMNQNQLAEELENKFKEVASKAVGGDYSEFSNRLKNFLKQKYERILDELDLSNNDLKDSGVKLISDALKTHNCPLHTLRLSGCNVTDECCESLSSCLQSSTSLRELHLSNNDLKDSGVKLISDALKTHNCPLHTLRLSGCNVTDECCESLSSCLQSSTSLRELDLSNNDLKDSGVKLISDALKTHNCQLHTLRLFGCNVTDECCESLSSCLQSSTSLRELDLSNNDLKDSGVKLISDALKTHNCQLHTLRLFGCNVTDECCESLSSCLQSSTSLRELDLSNNDLKDSGVKLISDALKTHNCQLHTLRLFGCNVTDGCCESLSSCLQSSTSLRELDLSNNDLKDSGVKLISDALKTHNCQLHTLRCIMTQFLHSKQKMSGTLTKNVLLKF
ncbi:putative NACHT [Triplophysa rosa]|uniref:NACHT n=1 Tax=Triplophysa rosa TaxID=992332 RepID=A0A9W7T943_TRIRA|nr:putative NACHT [Triplophysa rosa]